MDLHTPPDAGVPDATVWTPLYLIPPECVDSCRYEDELG